MKIVPLSTEERIALGFDYVATITHDDLTDTDTTQDITLASLTQGQFVLATGFRLITDFASANGTGLTLSLGNGSSATVYQAAKELQSTEVDNWFSDLTTAPQAGSADQVGETESLLARFITSGGTSPLLSEYGAGEVRIGFRILDTTKL